MKSLTIFSLLPTLIQAVSIPNKLKDNVADRSTSASVPTIWLAGDSTMAPGVGGNGTEGWGQYLHYSFPSTSTYVDNVAIAGRSLRTFTNKGRFQAIADEIQAGDWVIIEFGHNDGGSPLPSSQDNGRADCPGQGNETCVTVYDGVTEIVQTYPTYLKNASSIYLSLGAKVIISSPTPDNPWETGTFSYVPNRFTYYSWLSVSELGGPVAGIYFVDHGAYAAQAEKNLGAAVVDADFPMDHAHTAPYLADIVAQSFVLGLKCGTSGLADLVLNATGTLEWSVLGSCLAVNATLPV